MNLIGHLPTYYYRNKTMIELQDIISNKFNELSEDTSDTINQFFVDTATSLLSRYEKIYGIEVDTTKTDSFRRERIRAKVVGTGTTTKELIANTAKVFSGAEVEVTENYDDYSFVIKFVGKKGIPENMDSLVVAIEEIKPAHLAYSFTYTYNTWEMVSHDIWNNVQNLTWLELKTYNP